MSLAHLVRGNDAREGNTLISKEDLSIRERFNKVFQEKVDLRLRQPLAKCGKAVTVLTKL